MRKYNIDNTNCSSYYTGIFYAYDKYCKERNIQILNSITTIHEYFCFVMTHNMNVINKDVDVFNQEIYNININIEDPESRLLLIFTPSTNSIIFQDIIYDIFKDVDIDGFIIDNIEFIKFLCNYIIDNFKQK